ncbi:hypothetical protein GCM10010211_83590 [Streptomyces albospinus]|uniref:Uncharacterized protein n=1 Tax=Streptomyces albospinus TaxID=285515 RepID=A0ABQ2VPM3_9ACTN|nr:hypothetical protein GCM10010211_83590 [Streptomyces albospinus]
MPVHGAVRVGESATDGRPLTNAEGRAGTAGLNGVLPARGVVRDLPIQSALLAPASLGQGVLSVVGSFTHAVSQNVHSQ